MWARQGSDAWTVTMVPRKKYRHKLSYKFISWSCMMTLILLSRKDTATVKKIASWTQVLQIHAAALPLGRRILSPRALSAQCPPTFRESRGVATMSRERRCGAPLSSGDGVDKGKRLPRGCRFIFRGWGSAVSMADRHPDR